LEGQIRGIRRMVQDRDSASTSCSSWAAAEATLNRIRPRRLAISRRAVRAGQRRSRRAGALAKAFRAGRHLRPLREV